MKKLIAVLLALMPLHSFAQEQGQAEVQTDVQASAETIQPNFSAVLNQISDTHWKGKFRAHARVSVAGVPVTATCKGPILVRFFPETSDDMPGELPTVSYRHDADFNHNLNLLCETIGKHLSVVDVGSCQDFPKKTNLEGGKQVLVPFRTLIPRDGGNSAVVSSPACKDGAVVRSELQLKRLKVSDDGQSLGVEIILDTPTLKADLTYDLVRCEAPSICI